MQDRSGVVCNVDSNGYCVPQCSEPFGIDGTCSDNSHCKECLKCSSEIIYVDVGKCYNPKLSTLKVGETCNPTTGPTERRCVANTQSLPKKAKGKFACQRIASVGRACDEGKNVACGDGATCSSYNVCV